MKFSELLQAVGQTGSLPRVRYTGAPTKYIEPKAEGTVVAIKDRDGDKFRGCGVIFQGEFMGTSFTTWFHDSVDAADKRSHYLAELELVNPIPVSEEVPAPGKFHLRVITSTTVRQPVTPEYFKHIMLRDKPTELFHEKKEGALYTLSNYTDRSVEVNNGHGTQEVGFDNLYTKLALMDITLFSYTPS